ncbi:LLM class flavin-dependent oxidoreductase [Actinosynnema sp. NPDC020468]|uniref:LLM class flavin-dependent oxidoreductase n=1 Tax=Actinosynnema sp. NPDC020468 TaxID=3154488 RepID=UPI0033E376FA
MPERGGVPLSVLDTAPVWVDSTPARALRESVALARAVEGLGYCRYWVAEHHNTPSAATSSPAVLIAHLAAVTDTLRVGAGGVMLANHVPLVVAEQFATLQALYPGRIDLGLGRAPGADSAAALALRVGGTVEDFAGQVVEVAGLLRPAGPGEELTAMPRPEVETPVWVLGSGGAGVRLAAEAGLPLAFAHHIRPELTASALAAYRQAFRPSERLERPYAIVAAMVVAAESDERARWLFGPMRSTLATVLRGGRRGAFVTPAEAAGMVLTPQEVAMADQRYAGQVVGGPDAVKRKVAELVEATGADELMALTVVHDPEERVRSYRILAEAVS